MEEWPRNVYGDVLYGVEAPSTRRSSEVRLHGAEPETGCSEIDIYLGEKEYCGRGYATDAMRTMCRYGFEMMRLHKITLTVVTENHPALQRLRERSVSSGVRLREAVRREDSGTRC